MAVMTKQKILEQIRRQACLELDLVLTEFEYTEQLSKRLLRHFGAVLALSDLHQSLTGEPCATYWQDSEFYEHYKRTKIQEVK